VRHGVSAREIAELNNLKNMNDIRAGQKLLLPAYARSEKAAAKPAAPKPAAGTLSGDTYVVAAGDSLSKIAARFGVKTADLAAANQISNPNSIRIGQKLVIPKGGTASSAAPKPAPVTVAPIEEVPEPQPEIPVEEEIPAPAPVKVSEPVASSAAPAGDLFTHTVATGDTLESVARLFAVLKKDLAAANGLSEDAVLSAGQKLVIPFSSSAMAP
ncbi:MAG TPA: LysM peptidoglycan-binding domain-containing protein, partial [Kiritimatiellia bacterium]|nr:LysM peptidoglycan-binding domain-containing protein [Kiritimatiellia bacterium]